MATDPAASIAAPSEPERVERATKASRLFAVVAAPALVALHRISERAAQDGLGEERYWQLRERGAATPLDQIIRFALADVDDPTADSRACGRTDPRLKPACQAGP